MNNNCEKTLQSLSDYLDGLLDEKEKAEIEAHLLTCEKCRLELEELKHVISLTAVSSEFDLPLGFYESLHEKLMKENALINIKTEKRAVRIKYLQALSTLAAGFLIVFLLRDHFGASIMMKSRASESAADMSSQSADVKTSEKAAAASSKQTADAPKSPGGNVPEKGIIPAASPETKRDITAAAPSPSAQDAVRSAESPPTAQMSPAVAAESASRKSETYAAVDSGAGSASGENMMKFSLMHQTIPKLFYRAEDVKSITVLSADPESAFEITENYLEQFENDIEIIGFSRSSRIGESAEADLNVTITVKLTDLAINDLIEFLNLNFNSADLKINMKTVEDSVYGLQPGTENSITDKNECMLMFVR